jgi:RNA recognition motif-containing protein
MYQPAMQISTQPVLPVQQPAAHIYSSYPPSAVPVSQRLIPPSSPTTNNTAHYHHKNSVHRPVSKTSTPSSGRGSLSSTSNEGRTVYVYNLPHTISQQALKDHLAPAGVVDRCLVKEDRQRSSKYKLTAVATFRTPQQAQTAIDRFNRSVWKGYEIKVKLDRGPTTSGASGVRNSKATARGKEDQRELREGPLVVNGSGPRISSRQARVDSDDESSCDDGR